MKNAIFFYYGNATATAANDNISEFNGFKNSPIFDNGFWFRGRNYAPVSTTSVESTVSL